MNFSARFRPEHVDALRGLFAPRKPRHPLLRVVLGLAGVALLALLVVAGLFVGAAMLLGSAVLRLLRPGAPRAQSPAAQRVVDGEYSVVARSVLPSGR
jgi:hypothetical protein